MAVIDCFTYNGEREILDIHLNVLDKYVDKFIIVEAKHTFTGHKKPLYFGTHERFFEKFWHKIDYYVISENYTPDETRQAEESPNTKGARHWKREFLQKESIKKALVKNNVQDDDVCFIGDVDEIWDPEMALKVSHAPFKLNLKVYAYYLNNRSSEEFWGTLVSPYKHIKNSCLNHLRTSAWKTNFYAGWHFTSMGGLKQVRRKLDASYTPESYNTVAIQKALPERVREGVDYLGRNFTFVLDERDWPRYLTANRYKYSHLCKSNPIT